jgi:predicted secreted protein
VRPLGSEKYTGIIKELMNLFSESNVGVVQIPCPQADFNGGLKRRTKSKDAYDTKKYRTHCGKISSSLLKQIGKYLKEDYSVLGILGVEFSSTCGVHQIENGRRKTPGKGILMEEFESVMQKKNFQVPVIGVNLNNMFSSVEKVQALLNFS